MNRRTFLQSAGLATLFSAAGMRASRGEPYADDACRIINQWTTDSPDILLAAADGVADILIDKNDHPVVHIAAKMLADDLARVIGRAGDAGGKTGGAIIIGTIGVSSRIDALIRAGKLDVRAVRGKWESFVWQTVHQPAADIDRALVIAGADRRGTAYGVMELCEAAGVSPWHWWADVPVKSAACVAITPGRRVSGEPGVKYRGIFINDEDWGFEPWAAHTLDPKRGNVGPKTYQKVFDLMLRLKLNYLWPAMHPCSTAFAAIPQNAALASDYAIVMGSSHVEPMLANPATFLHAPGHKSRGPWNFVTNRAQILKFWKQSVASRGQYEAIWTIGMRGPYDSPLLGVHTLRQERGLVEKIFHIQENLINRLVSRRWGRPAECYVPYKEALLVFNSGLKVPEHATIIWPDNNFGYIRQLGDAAQRRRPGGSGVYYHIEYLGSPHSYCWLNTTPPALMWEELKKAWDNQARTIWVINVGGIKPREIGMDFAARMAWNPAAFGPQAQPQYLRSFAETVCGSHLAQATADMMREYFLLGQIRRPESMNRDWAAGLSAMQAAELMLRYRNLLAAQQKIAKQLPAGRRAAFFELFAYSAQMLSATGLVFLYDRQSRESAANAAKASRQIAFWRRFIVRQVAWYNNRLSAGKWRHYATMGGSTWRVKWADVQWPWVDHHTPPLHPAEEPLLTIPANQFHASRPAARAAWQSIAGLGRHGGAMALWPALPQNRWDPDRNLHKAPRMDFAFQVTSDQPHAALVLHVLPTYQLHPGMSLRVAAQLDRGPVHVLSVPYASSETRVAANHIRSAGVLDNQIQLRQAIGRISAGRHELTVFAVDPGLVLDEITLQRDPP